MAKLGMKTVKDKTIKDLGVALAVLVVGLGLVGQCGLITSIFAGCIIIVWIMIK